MPKRRRFERNGYDRFFRRKSRSPHVSFACGRTTAGLSGRIRPSLCRLRFRLYWHRIEPVARQPVRCNS